MDRREFVIGATAAAATLGLAPSHAQESFPSRPITIVNAFPPGGINDIVTRPLAAPVFDGFGNMVVALTAIGPSATLEASATSAPARSLIACARELSGRLGARPLAAA